MHIAGGSWNFRSHPFISLCLRPFQTHSFLEYILSSLFCTAVLFSASQYNLIINTLRILFKQQFSKNSFKYERTQRVAILECL